MYVWESQTVRMTNIALHLYLLNFTFCNSKSALNSLYDVRNMTIWPPKQKVHTEIYVLLFNRFLQKHNRNITHRRIICLSGLQVCTLLMLPITRGVITFYDESVIIFCQQAFADLEYMFHISFQILYVWIKRILVVTSELLYSFIMIQLLWVFK